MAPCITTPAWPSTSPALAGRGVFKSPLNALLSILGGSGGPRSRGFSSSRSRLPLDWEKAGSAVSGTWLHWAPRPLPGNPSWLLVPLESHPTDPTLLWPRPAFSPLSLSLTLSGAARSRSSGRRKGGFRLTDSGSRGGSPTYLQPGRGVSSGGH